MAARLTAFLDAFAHLRWEDFRGFLADDVTVFFPRAEKSRLVEGRPAVEEVFAAVFAEERAAGDGPPYLDLTPYDVRVREVGAVAVTTFHLAGEERLGRRTLVWESREGRWCIVHLHASNVARADRTYAVP